MEQITVRLSEALIEELDDIAEDSGRSRAEVIRDELHSDGDAEQLQAELARVRTERDQLHDDSERRIEYLETQIERLQRTNLKILEDRDRDTELELYVDDRREWEQAGILTRTKWRLVGKT
jgi:metal-responsive CopG/Arc/MetJ family transcriptional regulator